MKLNQSVPGNLLNLRKTIANRSLLWIVLAVLTLASPFSANAQTITAAVPVGSNPTSMAINPATNKIYVSNSYDGTVSVIDGITNNLLATIPVGITPGSIAINPITNQIYVVNTGSATVSVIAGVSSSVIATVTTEVSPNSIAVNTVTNQIYVTNYGSNGLTVIDGNNSNATSVVNVGIGPQALAINPATNKIYVVNQGAGPSHYPSVTIVDGASETVDTTVYPGTGQRSAIAVVVNPVSNQIYVLNGNMLTDIDGASYSVRSITMGSSPSSMAVNTATNQIFVANQLSNNVTFVDGPSFTAGASVATGNGPFSIAVNPVTDQVYTANLTGTATVITGQYNAPVNLATGARPAAVAINPVTNKIYVLNQGYDPTSGYSPDYGIVSVIDGASNYIGVIGTGAGPQGLVVNPVTNKTYVGNMTDGTVSIINFAGGPSKTVSVGVNPYALAVNPATNKIYVTNSPAYPTAGSVSIIDGNTDTVTATVPAGMSPNAIAVNPVTNTIYVANYYSGTMTVIDGSTNHTSTVPVGNTPAAVAVNPVTDEVFIANFDSNTMNVIGESFTAVVSVGTSPYALAVNPVTNTIYVVNAGSNNVSVINGAGLTQTGAPIPVGSYPISIDVNPVTNKIYVSNDDSNTVTVIDGATGNTVDVPVGSYPVYVKVNPTTNKIYVADYYPSAETVIDGATNATISIPNSGLYANEIAVNPITNEAFVTNYGSNNVTVIYEQQVQPVPLTTAITPLTNNQTTNPAPTFTFTSQTTAATKSHGVLFQVDSWTNSWSLATGTNPTFTGTLPSLQVGFHILYAYSVDGQEGTTAQALTLGGSPVTGTIQAYGFLVAAPLQSQTITFPKIAAQAVGRPLTLSASSSSGLQVVFASSTTSVCTVSGTTATFIAAGTCTIIASQPGNSVYSPAAPVTQSFAVSASSSTAIYNGLDSTTQGTWTGKYGADGYIIANDATRSPDYAAVSFTGATPYTWAASTSDARALQTASGASTRIASTYYASASFTISVNLTDGNSHRVALYLLDWDGSARAETISVVDAYSQAVLSSQSFSSFHNGNYAVWNIQGNVQIKVTRTGGSNAVVAGLFFDQSSLPTVTYVGLDSTTQGTWTGKYGADGYLIANDATKPPAYATVSLTGDTPYTWAASSTDVRALQTASGSSTRIASTYYSASNFSVSLNLTDGNTHKISLYLLDWDGSSRAETISILDAKSKAVLNTETFSSFHNGDYAAWNIKGNVIIQVTKTNGSNAVVSGLFFK